jgi:hypothetical protein
MERDFAANSLQMQQTAISPIQLLIADRKEFTGQHRDCGAF